MLSDEAITNPPIPPKILSDSLIMISATSGFNLNFLEIFIPSFDVFILCISIILPCAFETYFVDITMISPSCNSLLFFVMFLTMSQKHQIFLSFFLLKEGILLIASCFQDSFSFLLF